MIKHKYESKLIKTVDDVLCDICEKSCRTNWGSFEYMIMEAHWGYGSGCDGAYMLAHICEDCVFTKFKNIKFNNSTEVVEKE